MPLADAATTTGVDLLAFADDIVGVPSPRPAALRRAVSAAYYAVFHELVHTAVRQSIGTDSTHVNDRQAASRWYSHQDVRVVSGWVRAQARGERIPKKVQILLDLPPPDLVAFTEAVNDLQEARIVADYEYAVDVTVEDTRDILRIARSALARLADLPRDRVTENYLTLLLGGPRLPER
jgi:hypothetical protein